MVARTTPDSINVLDHGYVKLIETWGSDQRIVEAARMSTDKGFKGWRVECSNTDCCNGTVTYGPSIDEAEQKTCPVCKGAGSLPGDEKLLRYLYTHQHMTPFEMAGMVIEVQAPIFVFREWHRHRTQSYNEMSARYTPLPDVNYMPTVERITSDGGSNRQAQGTTGSRAVKESAENFREFLAERYSDCQWLYQHALASGIPKELARLILPVGRYSKMRASANLRNWLAFLTLRMAEGAQWEIRQYADAVGSIIAEKFPRTWELFAENRR